MTFKLFPNPEEMTTTGWEGRIVTCHKPVPHQATIYVDSLSGPSSSYIVNKWGCWEWDEDYKEPGIDEALGLDHMQERELLEALGLEDAPNPFPEAWPQTRRHGTRIAVFMGDDQQFAIIYVGNLGGPSFNYRKVANHWADTNIAGSPGIMDEFGLDVAMYDEILLELGMEDS